MKTIISALGATALLALTLGTGTAQADGYLTPGEKSTAAAMSGAICEFIDTNGVTTSSVTAMIRVVYREDEVASYGDAVDVINYAVESYCPEHWQQLVSFGEGARGFN